MVPTTVTLAVQWTDPATGLGRVVEDVGLSLLFVDGTTVTVPASEISTTSGATGVTYVHTASTVGVPGGQVRTMWTASLGGSALPSKIQNVPFVPLGPRPANKTVLTWQPPQHYAPVHYLVEEIEGGVAVRTVGTPTVPTVVDDYPFPTEIEARSVLYRIKAAHPRDKEQDDGSYWDYEELPLENTVTKWRTQQELCFLRDVIDGVDSRPGLGLLVNFTTHTPDMPRRIGLAQATDQTSIVRVTPYGELGVYLVRGALVDVGCAELRLRARFAVPDADTAKLSDLIFEPRLSFSSPH